MLNERVQNNSNDNSVLEKLTLFIEQDTEYRIRNPITAANDRHSYLLKMQTLQDIALHHSKTKSKDELSINNYVKDEIRKLKVQLEPSLSNYVFNGSVARFIIRLFSGSNKSVALHRKYLNAFQKEITEKQNFQQLNETLKKKGFHQNIDAILQKSIQHGLPKFSIRYYDVKAPDVNYILHCEKIAGTNAYQFSNFETSKHADSQVEVPHWHTFVPNQELSFNAREAAQLTIGKSICKSDDRWYFLDGKVLQSCSFNLEEKLKELPLENMGPQAMKSILTCLKAGLSKEISCKIDGNIERFTVEASPKNDCLVIRDRQKNYVSTNSIKETVKIGRTKSQALANKSNQKLKPKTKSIKM